MITKKRRIDREVETCENPETRVGRVQNSLAPGPRLIFACAQQPPRKWATTIRDSWKTRAAPIRTIGQAEWDRRVSRTLAI